MSRSTSFYLLMLGMTAMGAFACASADEPTSSRSASGPRLLTIGEATEISRLTGRPVLAVAGKAT